MLRLFNHYVPRSTLIIALLEAMLLAMSLFMAMHFLMELKNIAVPSQLGMRAAEFSGVMLSSMMLMGLYTNEPMNPEGWRGMFLRLVMAFMVGFAILGTIWWMSSTMEYVSIGLAVSVGTAMIVISVERLVFLRWITGSGAVIAGSNILVLGTGSRAAEVDKLLRGRTTIDSLQVVGYVPMNESQHAVPEHRMLVRREGEHLWEMAVRLEASEIIVGVRDRRNGGLPIEELLECKLRGFKVTEISSFFEREQGQVRLESLNSSWLVFGKGFQQSYMRNAVKRLFDFTASGLLLALALPVILLAAIAIVVTMGRPILYFQDRVGSDGRIFRIYKFRSMCNDAELDGKARWACDNDDRITPVGRIIRKLRIDELPQIFNVFKGDMSFVGPRPERPEFVSDLSTKIPFYDSRHSIRPGITGWAQVRYAYGASHEDSREKLQYDLYYVKNRSLFLDLSILMQTVEVVLWGKGAR